MKKLLLIVFVLNVFIVNAQQPTQKISVIAYYAGDAAHIDAYPVEKLTHIIFSFCHLQGNELHVDNKNDSLTIQHLVELKQRNSSLKIILSLGGWGGCKTCSPVFSTDKGRKEFAASVKQLNDYFKTDGIDIDWEYPGMIGDSNVYRPEDKQHYTVLFKELREGLNNLSLITRMKYYVTTAVGDLRVILIIQKWIKCSSIPIT